MQKIIIGSDHGGFKLKKELTEYLSNNNLSYEDAGCDSEDSCDYPIYAKKVADKVAQEKGIGILICGTGIGMCIAANKVKGIRAALAHDEFTAKMSREHNNANILCLGGRVINKETAIKILMTFLKTNFSSEDRHKRRVNEIMDIEK